MKSILAIALWCTMLLFLMYGMIAEVELREFKANKKVYHKALLDRALNQHNTAKEWTR